MYKILVLFAFIGSIAWLYLDPSPEPIVSLLITFSGFFRDELHGIIGSNIFSLTPRNKLIRDIETSKYSFISPEFINPRIIEDLIGWISDSGGQIVSVDVSSSNKSNRYLSSISVEENENCFPTVVAKYDQADFSYRYIGKSFSGMHLLQTWSCGGGSGVFCNIVLITLSLENALESSSEGSKKHDRFVIKLVGTIPLGDRYIGNINYKFGFLSISTCRGIASLRKKHAILAVI